MNMCKGLCILGILLLPWGGGRLAAQMTDYSLRYDTAYITAYKDELTSRLYLSRKQNGLHMKSKLLTPWLKYRTNDNLLIGTGITYSFITLNVAVKFPFVNVDDDIYGESRYVDLQLHTIFRSVIIDYYAQWNKGFHISNPQGVHPSYIQGTSLPYRGDLRTNIMGFNAQYLFNSRKYSYKAAFVQNEFQRKSAGSPIAGAEAYWVLAMSDSSMVGRDLAPSGYLGDAPFNQVDMMYMGINAGYAYTFVWKETLYLSLSTVFGAGLGAQYVHNTEASASLDSRFSYGISNSTRISFGFNTKHYYVGLSVVRFGVSNRVGTESDWMGYNTGNIRFNIVKRFITKRPIKALRPDLWILDR